MTVVEFSVCDFHIFIIFEDSLTQMFQKLEISKVQSQILRQNVYWIYAPYLNNFYLQYFQFQSFQKVYFVKVCQSLWL